MSADLVVIGGGPSGITASLFASKKGRSVSLVTRNFNGVRFCSGLFDVVIPPESFPETPISAIRDVLTHHREHILSKILDNEDEVMDVLSSVKDMFPFFRIQENEFLRFISDMGTLKPSWGALEWICSDKDVRGKKVILIWPEMLMGRTAEQITDALKSKGIEVEPLSLRFTGYGYYSAFKKGEFKGLIPSDLKADIVLFPPLGRVGNDGFLEVFPTMESVNGLWLEEKLRDMLVKNGVHIIEKSAVKGVVENAEAKKIICDDGEEVRGDVFLLATGKFAEGSFSGLEYDEPYHSLFFDLKLNLSGVVKSANMCNPFLNHSQKFFTLSVEVDKKMRAVNREDKVYNNLFCAGSLIANVDPFSWMMGFGFSTITAILAVKRIYE